MNELHNKDSGCFNLKGLLLLRRLKTMMVFIGPLSLSSSVSSSDEALGGQNVPSPCPSLFCILLYDLLLLLYSC